jgi:hypothetical protein
MIISPFWIGIGLHNFTECIIAQGRNVVKGGYGLLATSPVATKKSSPEILSRALFGTPFCVIIGAPPPHKKERSNI